MFEFLSNNYAIAEIRPLFWVIIIYLYKYGVYYLFIIKTRYLKCLSLSHTHTSSLLTCNTSHQHIKTVFHTTQILHLSPLGTLCCSPVPEQTQLEQAPGIMLLAAREHVHLAELVPLAQRRRVSLGHGLGDGGRTGRLGGRRQWRRRRPGSGCCGYCGASQ